MPASLGVQPRWLRGVEPFPTGELVSYDAGYLAGWTVERHQIDLVAAAARSRQQMEAEVRRLCTAAVPGDTPRNLVVQATLTDQKLKHILVPVWLMMYSYGATSIRWWSTASRGASRGVHPWSWIKITVLVIAVLFVLFLASFAKQS